MPSGCRDRRASSDVPARSPDRGVDGEEHELKYMLLMGGTQTDWDSMNTWAPEDLEAHFNHMNIIDKELRDSGELVDGQGLAPPDQAKIVVAGEGGAPEVTDGPFPEAKEFLAGYWMVECNSLDRALEIAARTSSAPGPGGAPMNMPIEVREVMEAPAAEEM